MGNLLARYGSLPPGAKAALIVAALFVLVLSVFLSPLVAVLALLEHLAMVLGCTASCMDEPLLQRPKEDSRPRRLHSRCRDQ